MILALKTSNDTTQAWLYAASGLEPVAHLEWESGRTLSDQLLSRLTVFMHKQDSDFTSLTGLIIFSGPGSFTSLRIGHTTINALADSLNIPVASATGENWLQTALDALPNTPSGQPVFPDYGAPVHITRPKT